MNTINKTKFDKLKLCFFFFFNKLWTSLRTQIGINHFLHCKLYLGLELKLEKSVQGGLFVRVKKKKHPKVEKTTKLGIERRASYAQR